MIPIVAKYVARGDDERTRVAFAFIGAGEVPPGLPARIAALQRRFEAVAVGESPPAVTAVRRMLQLIADGSAP